MDSATYPALLTVVQGWAADPSASEGFALAYPNGADMGLAFGDPTLVITLDGDNVGSLFLNPLFGHNVSFGIPYGQGAVGYPTQTGTIPLMLDLYRPTGAGTPALRPALICLHGGLGSSRQEGIVQICRTYAERGYVVASLNYRQLPDNPSVSVPGIGDQTDQDTRNVNAGFQDTAKAVRWMRANSEQYKIDPTRIALLGSSAGAVMSLFEGYLESDIIGTNAQVGAIVDLWGGMTGYEYLIDADDPLLFILHGTEDPKALYSFALALKQRCDEVGVTNKLFPIVGGGHTIFSGFWNHAVDGKTTDRHCAEFLFRQLNLLPLHPVAATTLNPLFLNSTNSTLPAPGDGVAGPPGGLTVVIVATPAGTTTTVTATTSAPATQLFLRVGAIR